MSKNERTTVPLGDLVFSSIITLNAVVELLEEKGILTKQEVLDRTKKLGEEARAGRGKAQVVDSLAKERAKWNTEI